MAFKETSGKVNRIAKIVEFCQGTRLKIFQGSESLLLSSLQAGAHGCVTALANIAPEWHRALIAAWQAGDLKIAQENQEKISQLAQMFLFSETTESFANFTYTLKFSLRLRGWIDTTDNFIPGFHSNTKFDQIIEDHIQKVGLLKVKKVECFKKPHLVSSILEND